MAIIILFNYLGQTDSKDKARPAQPAAESVSAASSDSIVRQLEEEKRLNLEMREIIRRLQGAIKNPAAVATLPDDQQQLPESSMSIPELKNDLIDGSFKKVSNPFIPGKTRLPLPDQKCRRPKMPTPFLSSRTFNVIRECRLSFLPPIRLQAIFPTTEAVFRKKTPKVLFLWVRTCLHIADIVHQRIERT